MQRKPVTSVLPLLLWFAVPASAQSAPPGDPLRELLTEVRALRMAVERAATVGTRLQVLVARVQLQEQRISDLSTRLAGVRSELRNIETGTGPMAAQLERFEEAIAETRDPEERRAAEQQVAMIKAQVDALERRRQELMADEAFLSQQLSMEQGRWTDFNDRLEQLERDLTPPR